MFLRENGNGKYKTSTIICGKELENMLRKEILNAKYIVIDLEKHIDKYRTIWVEGENGPRRC